MGVARGVRRDARRGPSGFTLIELLVVILILGILTAVVIFAVRGSQNRASAAAGDADRRTIRTAEEAYCAKFGTYGEMEDLVREKFLSEPSSLNTVAVVRPGHCGGTTFRIAPGPDQPSEPEALNYPGDGIAARLTDGRVLRVPLLQSTPNPPGAEVYDPNFGSLGTWSITAAPPRKPSTEARYMVLIDAPNCGLHCDEVLTYFQFGEEPDWHLYRRDALGSGSWTPAGKPSFLRAVGATATRLKGPKCGSNCGKVLVVAGLADFGPRGQTENTTSVVTADLWDPTQPPATAWRATTPLPVQGRAYHTATLLPDGRVLVVGGGGSRCSVVSCLGSPQTAAFYDPSSETWTVATPPSLSYDMGHSATLLPNGAVLVAGGSAPASTDQSEIFEPGLNAGQGAWFPAGQCRCDTFHTATLLPDDNKVMVVSAGEASNAPEFYDVLTGSWTSSAVFQQPRRRPTVTVLLDSRVLVAGGLTDSGDLANFELYG